MIIIFYGVTIQRAENISQLSQLITDWRLEFFGRKLREKNRKKMKFGFAHFKQN